MRSGMEGDKFARRLARSVPLGHTAKATAHTLENGVYWMAEQEETRRIRKTMSVPDAGLELGVGKNKSYDLAREGVIPTIQLGPKKLVVPIDLFRRRHFGPEAA